MKILIQDEMTIERLDLEMLQPNVRIKFLGQAAFVLVGTEETRRMCEALAWMFPEYLQSSREFRDSYGRAPMPGETTKDNVFDGILP